MTHTQSTDFLCLRDSRSEIAVPDGTSIVACAPPTIGRAQRCKASSGPGFLAHIRGTGANFGPRAAAEGRTPGRPRRRHRRRFSARARAQPEYLFGDVLHQHVGRAGSTDPAAVRGKFCCFLQPASQFVVHSNTGTHFCPGLFRKLSLAQLINQKRT